MGWHYCFAMQLADLNVIRPLALALLLPEFASAGEPGKMTREVWTGIPGSTLSDFTGSARYWQAADAVTTFSGAAAPLNVGSDFASRVRAYLTAPVTGDYTFWIASDDASELRISPNESKFGRVAIASVSTCVQPQQWDAKPSQKSALIRLVAGQRYFLEALHKEGGGADHVAIAWQIPGGARELIPATALESFTADPNDLDNDELPDVWEAAQGYSMTDNGTVNPGQHPLADPDQDGYSNLEESQLGTNPLVRGGAPGTLLLETWNDIPGSRIENLTIHPRYTALPDKSEFSYSAETPVNRADNYGTRMRGYVIAPATGAYTFYISGDYNCQLWLSPSGGQFAKQTAASISGSTNYLQWTKYSSQKSQTYTLQAGQRVYIEAIQKESTGPDHLEIGWKIPGSTAITVIPGSALESYSYDAEDPDGDNMPAAWEAAHGLDPAANDAASDPDYDGIPNLVEYNNGTDPQVKNTIAGALLQELWWNVPEDRTAYLDREPRLLELPDEHSLVLLAKGTENRPEHYANRLRGYLTAPVSGNYTFWAAGDDEVDFFLSTSASKFDKQLLIHPAIIGQDLDADISSKSRVVYLTAGQRYFMEIRHIDSHGADYCQVAWQKPGGAREIIPGSVLSTFIPTSDDLDDDDVPDAYEIANGLSPSDNGRVNPKNGARGDLDGDGLDNAAEFKAGTRADLEDTDGDGLNDRDELEMTKTQALMADAAPFEPVVSLDGAAFKNKHGSWFVNGKSLGQQNPRGWVEYEFSLDHEGLYQTKIVISPLIFDPSSAPVEVVFAIDGQQIGRDFIALQEGADSTVKMLTPWLRSGSHQLRVIVDNSVTSRRIAVKSVEVAAARGPDSNVNTRPDWVDARITHLNSFDVQLESYVSPFYFEGKTRWPGLATVAGNPVQTAPNNRWFTNVHLSPDGPTHIAASLENGALAKEAFLHWKAVNALSTENMTIRQGDSLRITAYAGSEASPAEFVFITSGGQTHSIQADQPQVCHFPTAGSFPVQVTHTLDGVSRASTLTVNVVATSVIESPVCVLGSFRKVKIPSLPSGVYLEIDDRIEILSTASDPDGSTIYVLRLNSLEDCSGVLRLGGKEGPVLDRLCVRTGACIPRDRCFQGSSGSSCGRICGG
jgi:hypothetical protein